MDIGAKIRSLIEQDEITQKQLANDLNISTTTLNGYIQNRRQPDAKMIIRLASYFHTSTDYLYGLTPFRELPILPYNADERHLINVYRAITDDNKPLYIEIGKTMSKKRTKK